MKNKLPGLLVILFFFLLFLLSLASCSTLKKEVENKETNRVENNSLNTESTEKTEKNRAIDDKIVVNVKTPDEAINSAIRNAFKDFSYSKESGTNSTNMTFDPDLMAFRIANYIGETQDKQTSSLVEKSKELSIEERADRYIEKRLKSLPWWVYVIGVIYFGPKLMTGIGSILNPLGLVISRFRKS